MRWANWTKARLVLGVAVFVPAIIGCPLGSGGGGVGAGFNLAPRAVLTVSPDPATGVAPLLVQFDSSGSTDDGIIVDRAWDFGNGDTSREIAPLATYDSNGVFTVRLVLTDDQGAVSTTSTVVRVSEAPVATFTIAFVPDGGAPIPGQTAAQLSPATLEFDARASFDPDAATGDRLIYAWEFGDGATSAADVVRHTYSRSGTFRVTLTVTDASGIDARTEGFVDVGIRQPVIAFRSPPDEITELVVSRTSPLWTYVSFAVEPGVPYTIRAGLDVDRDPNNRNDIRIDNDALDGVLIDDLPLTVPTALDLDIFPEIAAGSYNLWAELRTDRTSPVRTYANPKVRVIDDFTTTTPPAPRVPLTLGADGAERLRVVAPRGGTGQPRFVCDMGPLNVGDRLFLSVLTLPGYSETYDQDGFRFHLLDTSQELFVYLDSDDTQVDLFGPQTSFLVRRASDRNYLVMDAPAARTPAASMTVRVIRNAVPTTFQPPVQRVFLDFEAGVSVSVGPRPGAFQVPRFDPNNPRDDNAIRTRIEERVRAFLQPYVVEVTSSFNQALPNSPNPAPAAPYTVVYFDTSTSFSPETYLAGELLTFGQSSFLDPRNSTLSGAAVIAANQVEDQFGAGLTDAQFADALAIAALHQLGLNFGLRRTQTPAADIMNTAASTVLVATGFANTGVLAMPSGVTAIGTQNAPKILGDVLGLK